MDAQQSSYGNMGAERGRGTTVPCELAPTVPAIDPRPQRDFGWVLQRSQTVYPKQRQYSPRKTDRVPIEVFPSFAPAERVLFVGAPGKENLQSLAESKAQVTVLVTNRVILPVESFPELQWYTGPLSAFARKWDRCFDRVFLALAENEAELADGWAMLAPQGLLHFTFSPDSLRWRRTCDELGGVVRKQFFLAGGMRALAVQKGGKRLAGSRSRGVAA